ncbi:hypothetical protein AMAG_00753 [Allomyces macrogynus ATCC 38327]|uniref:Uncharacterized protein n=1 Tax=Allomyces macrogynus (strain ATCC 38327) TaxID=578462 RepID=A0A0L0RXC4_ALLM3|nr:hypothetical protein AMAG_00753 [Allomyces macrogynus ATCC 38327]|eukprot:KNE54800.1 hypothetical protein AMAG_00753 [Allomyces macrogynus ATCC 38327]
MPGGEGEERSINNDDDRIEAAWDQLEPKLHARVRYLREVDVVSRGYRLQSERSAIPWGADSLRKPGQRALLATCLGQLLISFTTALADPELTSLISGFAAAGAADSAVPSMQHLRELIDCCAHLAEAVIERANTGPTTEPWGDAVLAALERATRTLDETDPLATSPISTSDAVTDADPSTSNGNTQPISTAPRPQLRLLYDQIRTIQVKAHLALTEPDMTDSLVNAMGADLAYAQALHQQLVAVPSTTTHPLDQDLATADQAEPTAPEPVPGTTFHTDAADALPHLHGSGWMGEAKVDVAEGDTVRRRGPRLTREERIAQRRAQQRVDAQARVDRMAPAVLVDELKDVLRLHPLAAAAREWEATAGGAETARG